MRERGVADDDDSVLLRRIGIAREIPDEVDETIVPASDVVVGIDRRPSCPSARSPEIGGGEELVEGGAEGGRVGLGNEPSVAGSSTSSGIPLCRVEITGSPHAIASMMTTGTPS